MNDRNLLFELVNRQIKALVTRMKRCNTIGLDQRLLRELLYAGIKCPTFNERMKYTLCANSEDQTEILRFQDMGKWFPFDTLVKLPNFDEQVLLVCSLGPVSGSGMEANMPLHSAVLRQPDFKGNVPGPR